MSNLPALPSPVPGRVRDLLRTEGVKRRFEEVLEHRSAQFIASLAQLIYTTPGMDDCEPDSVFSAALIAAVLNLPIDKNLGQAWIIPYNDKQARCKKAQFQMGYKGYIQLALRTGQYKTIHVTEVYEGEVSLNHFTGEVVLGERKSNKVTGYLAYIALLNGYEKYLHMTIEEVTKHAAKYSKNYQRDSSVWKTNFDAMARKTLVKAILTKWGVLSVEVLEAIRSESFWNDENEEDSTGDEPAQPLTKEQKKAGAAALFGEEDTSEPAESATPTAPPAPAKKETVNQPQPADQAMWANYVKLETQAHELGIYTPTLSIDLSKPELAAAFNGLQKAVNAARTAASIKDASDRDTGKALGGDPSRDGSD